VNVSLPAEATVYLRGQKMTITGPVRRYVIPLPNGTSTFDYPMKVELTGADGKTSETNSTLKIKGGAVIEVKVNSDDNLQLTLAAK